MGEIATAHTYAIFSALYAPHMGGVEAYTAGLAHELAEQGNRVIVATSRLSQSDALWELQSDGVEIYRLPCRALMDGRLPVPVHNALHSALVEQVAIAQPDRVVVNTRFYGHSLDGLQFAADQGIPAVLIEHGSAHLSLGASLADAAIERYEHRVTERVKSYNPTFAAVSEKARAWLGHFGIEDAAIVPNALASECWEVGPEEGSAHDYRAELGLNADDVLVAVVGRLVPEKGILAVVESAGLLASDATREAASACADARIVFAVAGDGPLLGQVEQAQKDGLPVRALGRLAPIDVRALLSASDAYLLPSRSEGFATTLLEAVAAGAFPIATDVGGVDELEIGRLGGIVLPDASAASIIAALDVLCDQRDACRVQVQALREHARDANTWEESTCALDRAFQVAGASGSREQASCAGPIAAAAGDSDEKACEQDAGSNTKAVAPRLFGRKRTRLTPGERISVAAVEQAEAVGDTATFEGDERLDKLHGVLLMMMKDFAAICERENLTWIAMYGTAIGALRHGGFVPWDDDIDICMLRSDLMRFEQAVQADPSGKYSIVNAQLYPKYPLTTTRFVLNGTEFRDSALATMDFPSGIFLDVFPLDSLADNELLYQGQVWGSWFMNKLATAKLVEAPTIVRGGAMGRAMDAAAKAGHAVLNLPWVCALNPNNTALRLLTRLEDRETRRVGYTCDTFPYGCLYERDELLPVRWVPFEDMEVPIAREAEKLLTDYYGDWTCPPPGNARRIHYPDVLDFGPYV